MNIKSKATMIQCLWCMKVTKPFTQLNTLTDILKAHKSSILFFFHLNMFAEMFVCSHWLFLMITPSYGLSVSICGLFFSISIKKNKISPNGSISCSATLRQENIKTGWRQEIKTGCRFFVLKNSWKQISENRLASFLV